MFFVKSVLAKRRNFSCILKNVDVGYCGKLSEVRERGLATVSAGGKAGVSVLENEVNSADN